MAALTPFRTASLFQAPFTGCSIATLSPSPTSIDCLYRTTRCLPSCRAYSPINSSASVCRVVAPIGRTRPICTVIEKLRCC